MSFENQNWLVLVLVLVVVATAVFFIARSRRQPRPQQDAPRQDTVETQKSISAPEVPAAIEVPAPAKKVSRFGKALLAWRDLFQEESRDQRRWEEALITSDMGPKLTQNLLAKLESSSLKPLEFFKQELSQMIGRAEVSDEPWMEHRPWTLFIVGVNGVGKTTTIVKLANFFHQQKNLKVGVVGADTFRKAAIEQLERGCQRVGVDFFSIHASGEETEGADPSAVVFDGLQKFREKDVIIVDTSGRLHSKKNLMEELKKMKRVAQKVIPTAPNDVWLVIDATLGQNAISQGRAFHEAIGLTGLVLTKLDGLSRGGTVFQLFQELTVPIRFLGVGEAPGDLEPFKSDNFVEELFDQDSPNS